ncbi:MAG: cytosine permease [Candidatus Methanomethyliaceae archaeon]|nr:cytosine permease [Candidatus Methanomethyliaceae archaeon]
MDKEAKLFSWTVVAPTLGVIFVSPAILAVGGALGTILPFWYAIATSIIAAVTISLLIYFHGGVGAKVHLPLTRLMEASLGVNGSRFIVSPLIAITQIGWYSVNITLGGEAFSNLTGLDRLLMITLFGIIVASVTYSGFSRLSDFTKLTAFLTAIFAIWALYAILTQGLTFISPSISTEGLLYAAGLAIGGAASISTVSPDFLKDASRHRDLWITSFGIILPLMLFTFISGNLMGAFTAIPNPIFALVAIGMPLIANLLLLLGSSAAASSLYPPTFALANIFKIPRNYATIPAAAVGLLLAYLGILEQLTFFLRIIGILLPPIIGINLAEYYLVSKRRIVTREGFNIIGFFSWLIGAATGYLLVVGIAPINALFSSMILYFLLYSIKEKRRRNPALRL